MFFLPFHRLAFVVSFGFLLCIMQLVVKRVFDWFRAYSTLVIELLHMVTQKHIVWLRFIFYLLLHINAGSEVRESRGNARESTKRISNHTLESL